MMMGFSFGGFGFLFMLLFWLLIIGLAVWVIAQFFSRTNTLTTNGSKQFTSQQGTALEVLKQRYARGEITKSEYEKMRTDIEA
ncbi:MAG TPA: SHOCT domain-containing protein [Anaerolineae bacterium]|nr:SHOCT domain-containing protein [Anaerolineae bacterium]